MDFLFLLYLLTGDELGSANCIDRLRVSQALFTPTFSLIGNDYFFSCRVNLVVSKFCEQTHFFFFFWVFADMSAKSSPFLLKFRKVDTRCVRTYTFFFNLQYYVRISSANFRILTRKIGGARTSQPKIRSINSKAGPARRKFESFKLGMSL